MRSGIKILIVRKRWEIDCTFIKISFHDVTRERERESLAPAVKYK